MLLYNRYVDDCNQALVALTPGTRWDPLQGKMVLKPEFVVPDNDIPPDQRTKEEIIKMGNSINHMIKLTGDCPSLNSDKKMPVLDLKCWVGPDNSLWWQLYRKPVSNYFVILANSAMPWKIKRTSLTQKVVRILRNCRLDLPWEEKLPPQ